MSVLSAPSPDEEPSQDSARPSPRPQIALPDPNIHEGRDATFHVHAQVSGEHTILGGRDIAVMLPREHTQDPKRRFPVLFMLDGENLFESLPSTFQGPKWQVAKTCRCLINEGAMEPVIIVAISNGGNAARMADYTHKSHPEWPEGATGFAHNFAAFLYTASCTHCTPVSLGQGGEGLGTMWGWETAEAMLREAGFETVQRHVLEHDPMNVWFVSRKDGTYPMS